MTGSAGRRIGRAGSAPSQRRAVALAGERRVRSTASLVLRRKLCPNFQTCLLTRSDQTQVPGLSRQLRLQRGYRIPSQMHRILQLRHIPKGHDAPKLAALSTPDQFLGNRQQRRGGRDHPLFQRDAIGNFFALIRKHRVPLATYSLCVFWSSRMSPSIRRGPTHTSMPNLNMCVTLFSFLAAFDGMSGRQAEYKSHLCPISGVAGGRACGIAP